MTAKSKKSQPAAVKTKARTRAKAKPKYQYDAVVIGTGPGGEGAAMNLTKAGKKVAVVEKHSQVGGGCTHWGTIPSKALRHSVSRLIEYNSNPLFNKSEKAASLTFEDILSHTTKVIRDQVRLRGGFYTRNEVDIHHGSASFVDAHTLTIESEDGSVETITTDQVVIATGSRPYRPANVNFNHPRIYDSDTILSLKHEPKKHHYLRCGCYRL